MTGPVPRLALRLLGAVRLLGPDGEPVPVGAASMRLVAHLGAHGRPRTRREVAATLWPDAADGRAEANLRSAVWRLDGVAREAVRVADGTLALAPHVHVDLPDARRVLVGLIDGTLGDDALPAPDDALDEVLLPGLADDWAAVEREQHRQLVLHALEALAERQLAAGRMAAAALAAARAVRVDPLRESAQRVLMRVHAAEGNASEIARQYDLYRALLHRALGIGPSPALAALVREACAGEAAAP